MIATWLVGLALPPRDRSLATPAFGLFGAISIGGGMAVGMSGLGTASCAARSPGGFPGRADGMLGAALSACVALGLAWMLGAVAARDAARSRGLRSEVERS